MKRRPHVWSIALLLVVPLVLLWPSVGGGKTFVPWDIGQFPPAATLMTADELAAATRDDNTIITETPTMFVPELRFMHGEFERGRFPQWNPYSRSGTGVWSNSILGLWYPINWFLFLGDDPQDALGVLAYVSLVIAGMLMYGFLIHLGVGARGAVFGGLVFALSGTLTVNLAFYQRVNALIWLPGMLWAIGVIAQRDGVRRVPAMLCLAACMFMAHVAGFPAFAIAVSVLAILFTLYKLGGRMRADGVGAGVAFGLAVAAGAVGGVMLGLVQTLPMFEFFPESNRTMEPVDNVLASGGFDPAGWLGYLCPTVFNHPFLNHPGGLLDQYSPLFWSLYSRSSWIEQDGIAAGTVLTPNYNFCEYTVFVGIVTLFFAAAGALDRRTPLRGLAVLMLAFLATAATAPALLEPLLEAPPFRWIPPPRYMGPVCMLLALLAAAGVSRLGDFSSAVRRGLWIVGYLVAAGFWSAAAWAGGKSPEGLLAALKPALLEKYGAKFPHLEAAQIAGHIDTHMGTEMVGARAQMVANFATAGTATLLCATLFLLLPRVLRWRHGASAVFGVVLFMMVYELLSFGMPLCTGRELQGRPLNDTPVHAFLRGQRDAHATTGGFAILRAHDPAVRPGKVLPTQLPPDTLLIDRIRDQQAYTFVDNRSHLPYVEMFGADHLIRGTWPYSIPDGATLRLPYFDLLGVRFVLSEDVLKNAGTRVGPILEGPGNGRRFYIYEREQPLPRAWVVHQFETLGPPEGLHVRTHAGPFAGGPAEDALVKRLVDPGFRPKDAVLLDRTVADALGAAAHRSTTPGNTRAVTFPIAEQTSALTIEVAAGEPGYLVCNDTFMSGWSVTVNGAPATIHRANLFQRMVVLPPEAATVAFEYVTPGLVPGLVLAGLALLALLGLAVFHRLRLRAD